MGYIAITIAINSLILPFGKNPHISILFLVFFEITTTVISIYYIIGYFLVAIGGTETIKKIIER